MSFRLLFALALATLHLAAAPPDSTAHIRRDRLRVLVYGRVIGNCDGRWRTDQNVVASFMPNRWLRINAGIRLGERPENSNAYYHYKLELGTRHFWNTTRIFARISDNVVHDAEPAYRRTHKLVVVEHRIAMSGPYQGLIACGYEFLSQQDNSSDALPLIARNKVSSYPIFKIGVLRWFDAINGYLEAAFGSYDVFNAYEIDRPFLQLTMHQELSGRLALRSYYRYQMDGSVTRPYNNYLGVGLSFHVAAK